MRLFNREKYLSVILFGFGVTYIFLFLGGIYPPVLLSVIIIILSALSLIMLWQRSWVGPLTILLFVVYVLPFIHIFPYIWFDFNAESPLILWGLAVNPYMTDKATIELMSMMGAVGAVGFVVGASLLKKKLSMNFLDEEIVLYRRVSNTLSLQAFLLWVAIAFVLSWVSSPSETIFTVAYTESRAISEKWNFSSLTRISYTFLIFALADCMFEKSERIRNVKRIIIFLSFLFITIWFQLFRGDREILPCVLAAGLMYYVWGKGLLYSSEEKIKFKWPILLFLSFCIFIVALIVANLRHILIGVDSIYEFKYALSVLLESDSLKFNNIFSGTWSAVLLTPLSVAGDYINGSLPLKYGRTYMDLLASIIPGFIADWIGFTRPIDALHGPAWEMTYGQGGTHAIVVPFMNFRMWGIFLVVALWSFTFSKIEHFVFKRPNVLNISLLGAIATSIPHWLWYGEKNIINALIIWLFLSTAYKVRFSTSIKTEYPLRANSKQT